MFKKKFKSFFVRKVNNNCTYEKKNYSFGKIEKNDLIIKINYSSINFKDYLICTGKYWDARKYPIIPGIDCAGKVVYSRNNNFKIGENVAVIASPAGSKTNGGYSQYIKINSIWVNKLPKKLDTKNSMIFGTAGFTAMYVVNHILKSKVNKKLPILITGGSGGVGSFSIFILNKLGFKVIASTRSIKNKNYLKHIGADNIILDKDLKSESGLSLQKQTFSACIDTVGGDRLDFASKRLSYGANYFSIGFSKSNEIANINLTPFILRGIKLIGVHTESITFKERKNIWKKISSFQKVHKTPKKLFKEIKFNQIENCLKKFKSNKNGRFVIKIQ